MIITWTNVFILLAIGGVCGWLAGLIWKGSGFGLAWDIILGVAGSFLGGWLFHQFGIYHVGILGFMAAAIVGALILIFIGTQIRKRRR